jgi:hypothetical protein
VNVLNGSFNTSTLASDPTGTATPGSPAAGAQPESLYRQGQVLSTLGLHDSALKRYNRVVKDSPRNYQAWSDRGYTLEASPSVSSRTPKPPSAVSIGSSSSTPTTTAPGTTGAKSYSSTKIIRLQSIASIAPSIFGPKNIRLGTIALPPSRPKTSTKTPSPVWMWP